MSTKITHIGDIKFPKPGDVGHDLFFTAVKETTGKFSNGILTLRPGESAKLYTGVVITDAKPSPWRVRLLSWLFGAPVEILVKIEDRSGVAGDRNLKVSGGIIDPSYNRGEIIVKITNIGTQVEKLHVGERICQFIVVVTLRPDDDKRMTIDHSSLEETHRGDKGFGSSGQF